MFNKEWKPNKKGTANATHDRVDAVGQRNTCTRNNRDREHQCLVWHHEELAALKLRMPHTHKCALIAQRLRHETETMTKKFAHAPSAELMHAMYVYERKGKTMVEFHVDSLEVGERQRLCPD